MKKFSLKFILFVIISVFSSLAYADGVFSRYYNTSYDFSVAVPLEKYEQDTNEGSKINELEFIKKSNIIPSKDYFKGHGALAGDGIAIKNKNEDTSILVYGTYILHGFNAENLAEDRIKESFDAANLDYNKFIKKYYNGKLPKEIDELKVKQEEELSRVSELSKAEAREILLRKIREELTHDMAVTIREFETKLDEEKEKISQKILSTAIGKAAADYVADATVSVINLPNDEMKGRIIGREGRNIRTIEALTGVDVIIDDTPEAVVLSCFDGVKREIARLTIEKLITDGRIHPGKIEEIVNKCKKDIEKEIVAAGEEALIELSIPTMHPEIIKTLGRLKYRTSYGQNVLTHSIEVAKIASTMAAEIGANVELAKRGGLLHDIGKVLVNEIETSHAIVGGEFIKRFGEKQDVINAVMAHHNEVEFETVEAILVQAADAVSASRPGARRETLTAYIKRLENLEEIANSFEGVESSYAIQAGRELRIVINPDKVSDDEATLMSREVAKKIEDTMQYPGQIKVTILRETRAVEYAK